MKTLLAAILFSSALHAQNVLWIDLSGPWLSRAGEDRPEFAQPGFDDRDWTPYPLPAQAPPTRSLWLRKTVELPPGAPRDSLALTLGIVNDAYEVFVNGIRIGASGPLKEFDPDWELARPLTFPIPPASDTRLTIAIRSKRFIFMGAGLRGQASGPFLLTSVPQAPKDAGVAYRNSQVLRILPDVIIALLLALSGLVFVLVWLRERDQVSLLWFAILLVSAGFLGLINASFWLPANAHPFRWWLIQQVANSVAPPAMILLAASIYGFRQRWILGTVCVVSALPRLFAYYGGISDIKYVTYPLMALYMAAAALTAFGWWRRGGLRLGGREHLLAAALIAVSYFRTSGFVSGFFRVEVGRFTINTFLVALLVLSIPIMAELLARVRERNRERRRLQEEMQAARLVQQFLLAERPGHIDVVYEPAHEVGGDFAFTFPVADGSQLIATGDVSGKGLKAAMTVSLIAGALRNRRSSDPAEVLAELNGALLGGLGFVTAVVVRCDPTGSLRLACAGHPAPYLGGREYEVEPGLPLGIAADASYAERTAWLDAGQQLTLVSDGVVEAENAQRELFGFDRTREISTKSAQEIADTAKAWGQNDDITVVTVRRNA